MQKPSTKSYLPTGSWQKDILCVCLFLDFSKFEAKTTTITTKDNNNNNKKIFWHRVYFNINNDLLKLQMFPSKSNIKLFKNVSLNIDPISLSQQSTIDYYTFCNYLLFTCCQNKRVCFFILNIRLFSNLFFHHWKRRKGTEKVIQVHSHAIVFHFQFSTGSILLQLSPAHLICMAVAYPKKNRLQTHPDPVSLNNTKACPRK